MIVPRDLAKKIIDRFDPKSSRKIEELLTEIFREEGFGRYESEIKATEYCNSVLNVLKEFRFEELPFEFSLKYQSRLVGKLRKRKKETQETYLARQMWQFSDQVLKAILKKDDKFFEILCAACLKLSGANEAYALCSSDEGGIDIFGRIPLAPDLYKIKSGILETNLLKFNILFLGQCKRYKLDNKIGPRDIREFKTAVKDCLDKYDENSNPPSHKIPEKFYIKGESCIPIFMTTSDYSASASGVAKSSSIFLINGRQIAEFLSSKMVGIIYQNKKYHFNKDKFYFWFEKERKNIDYREIHNLFIV